MSEAISSAVDQTYPTEKYEVIVVDDGSTCAEPDAVVSSFKNVKLIKTPHGGIAHALNAGIKVMQGRYFKWLSSDDALRKHGLEALIAAAKDDTIVYGDWCFMDEQSHVVGLHNEPIFDNDNAMKQYVWRRYFGNTSATLIPRRIFSQVGVYDEGLPYVEDYEWALRAILLHDCKFVHVDEAIANYRIHEGQITKRMFQKSLVEWQVRRRLYPSLQKNLFAKPSYNEVVTHMFFQNLSRLYREIFSRPPVSPLKRFAKLWK